MILPPSMRRGFVRRADREAVLGEPNAAAVRLSQYYTRPTVAARLYAVFCGLLDPTRFLLVEPSAGTGSFLALMPPGSRGFDIDPKRAGIEARDFLETRIGGDRPIAFIGNPPFSKGMAIRFFNRAAHEVEAQVIAFVLPKSFRKAAVQNKLNRDFHLLHEEEVERDAFVFGSRQVHVPCVFQIWIRRGVKRELIVLPTTHEDFAFVNEPLPGDFGLQRIGANAGRVHDDLGRSGQAHYFIRPNRPGVRAVLESLDFDDVTRDVAAKPSLAKTELVSLYADGVARFGYRAADTGFRMGSVAG